MSKNNHKSGILAIAAALLAGNLSAQCSGAANSNLISLLGSAGPSNFAVLSLGGSNALVNINLATIDGPIGNVGVPNTGTLKKSAPSAASGNLIVGSQVNTSGVIGANGGIIIDDALLSGAVHDANYASSTLAMLTPTSPVQAQFTSDGQIRGNLTVTGTVGLNAINTMDSSSYVGEVIGGYGKSVVLMSGTHVTNPCPAAAPPPTE